MRLYLRRQHTADQRHLASLLDLRASPGATPGMRAGVAVHAEEFVRSRGGAMLVIETGGRPDYAGQRCFYEKHGYAEVGRIPDFYKAGDDGIIYWKRLRAQ